MSRTHPVVLLERADYPRLSGLGERLLDQLANDELHELRGLFDRDADGLGLVSDFAPEIRCEPDTLLAKLMLDQKKRDLPFANVVHDGPPVNVLLPRNLRSPDSQVHLRNTLSIAENILAVKSNRGNRKSPKIWAFSGFLYWIKKFSSPKIKIWFEPMFFSGFFCGFERCGSAVFPNFCGGVFSPKCVRTNSRILHQKGKVKEFWFASLRSATNSYSILGVKTNSRFRILGEENFLILNPQTI